MRKAPFRPMGEITQPFNDGIVTFYTVENVAAPGLKPVEKLREKIKLRYEERRTGLQRYYSGMQNQVQIERVIRVPRAGALSSQDVAITEEGNQYRVDLVQAVLDVWPAAVDVTLAKIDQIYEVEEDVLA